MQRIYVVSGGGTGIGRAIARSLAVQGDQVVIVGRRAAVLDTTAREIDDATAPGRVRPYALDGTDPEAVTAFADALGDEHEVIDGVINNAGGSTAPRGDLSGVAAAWRQTFEQNVMTAVLLTTALAPRLRRPGGRVVLVSSMATRSGGGGAHYVAAKSALNGWVLALSNDLAPQGVTANVVLPGYTPDTELFGDGLPQEVHDRIVSRIAAGRAGRSDDVAGVVRYLVSPEADFVTGQAIEVSGGILPPNV